MQSPYVKVDCESFVADRPTLCSGCFFGRGPYEPADDYEDCTADHDCNS